MFWKLLYGLRFGFSVGWMFVVFIFFGGCEVRFSNFFFRGFRGKCGSERSLYEIVGERLDLVLFEINSFLVLDLVVLVNIFFKV